jgi:hypothetical protein
MQDRSSIYTVYSGAYKNSQGGQERDSEPDIWKEERQFGENLP